MCERPEDVKCPRCGNQKELEWEEDPSYFDPSDKSFEVKEIVFCPNCSKDFAVFSQYKKTRRDAIKPDDIIYEMGDKVFKLVNIDVIQNADQQ